MFHTISHNRDDGYNASEKLDGLWLNKEGSDEEEEEEEPETVFPEQAAAYYGGPVEELTIGNDDLIEDEDMFPVLKQITEDETLLNPVFWYEMDEMKQPVNTEGEVWKIRQIQNVGLAYYAIPSEFLAWVVDKVTDTQATKRSKTLRR